MRMPTKTPAAIEMTSVILMFIMCLLGSLASYCYRVLNGQKFRPGILGLQIVISFFAGSLVFMAAWYFEWHQAIGGGLSGLAGWSGAALVKAVEKRFLSKVSEI